MMHELEIDLDKETIQTLIAKDVLVEPGLNKEDNYIWVIDIDPDNPRKCKWLYINKNSKDWAWVRMKK